MRRAPVERVVAVARREPHAVRRIVFGSLRTAERCLRNRERREWRRTRSRWQDLVPLRHDETDDPERCKNADDHSNGDHEKQAAEEVPRSHVGETRRRSRRLMLRTAPSVRRLILPPPIRSGLLCLWRLATRCHAAESTVSPGLRDERPRCTFASFIDDSAHDKLSALAVECFKTQFRRWVRGEHHLIPS